MASTVIIGGAGGIGSAAAEYSVSLHPLKRFGEVDDIAGLIEFLTSPKSSWMTGQVIGADGGLSTLKTK